MRKMYRPRRRKRVQQKDRHAASAKLKGGGSGQSASSGKARYSLIRPIVDAKELVASGRHVRFAFGAFLAREPVHWIVMGHGFQQQSMIRNRTRHSSGGPLLEVLILLAS